MLRIRVVVVGLFVANILAGLTPRTLADEKQIDADGVKIHFTDEGQGTPVILIHGFAANAEMNWRAPGVTGALVENYRVIAMDVRGHGESDQPHHPDAYGTEMVKDVIRILDHLKIDKAHVIGYSMGGFITMKLLVEHPQRVVSATLGGSGGIREDFDHRWDKAMADELEAGQSFTEALQSTLPDDANLTDEQLLVMQFLFKDRDGKALAAVLRSWQDLAVSYMQLEKNKIPTLVIYGSKEDKGTRTYIESLKGRMANSTFQMIDGADHLTTAANPQFRDAILKFIADHSGQ